MGYGDGMGWKWKGPETNQVMHSPTVLPAMGQIETLSAGLHVGERFTVQTGYSMVVGACLFFPGRWVLT